MNTIKNICFGFCLALVLAPALAEESNYIKSNKERNWERTSVKRLASVINNPRRYNPEEFVAALHEYSKRYGMADRPKNTLEALVNAYIARNPDYRDRPTEDIFVLAAKARGVPSLRGADSSLARTAPAALTKDDYVSLILEYIKKNIHSYELLNAGLYDDDNIFIVYKVTDTITVTVSIDKDGSKYIIGNVTSADSLRKALDYLTGFYSVPVPALSGGGYEAILYDSNNTYIKDNMPEYAATITVYKDQMFVEEVNTHEKTINQRQWCTSALEADAGFVASWE